MFFGCAPQQKMLSIDDVEKQRAEYLDGKINCKLIIDGECILDDQSDKAALEIIGDTNTLIKSVK